MASFGNVKVDYREVISDLEVVPAGYYQAVVIESGGRPDNERTCPDGLVATKNGKGRYLPFRFEIIEGEMKGRQLTHCFNMENVNPLTVQIAQKSMRELLNAIGWDFVAKPFGPDETNEVHMIPLTIQVAVENDRLTGEMRNSIKHFHARQVPGATPVAAAPRAKAAVSAPAPVPAVPPWARQEAGK